MKMPMCSLAMLLVFLTNSVRADQIIIVDGESYFLSHLTESCQSITGDPAAQIACFSAISRLLDEQDIDLPDKTDDVIPNLDALRAAAEYHDEESGLSIIGSDCNIHVLYFNNYFHVSRRNISEIDLFSAQFDASKLLLDQTVAVQGSQAPLIKGVMSEGENAVTRGGIAIDSLQHGFAPRSPRVPLDTYANEVVDQLPPAAHQTFDFVLVHPKKRDARVNIMNAFETFVNACKG